MMLNPALAALWRGAEIPPWFHPAWDAALTLLLFLVAWLAWSGRKQRDEATRLLVESRPDPSAWPLSRAIRMDLRSIAVDPAGRVRSRFHIVNRSPFDWRVDKAEVREVHDDQGAPHLKEPAVAVGLVDGGNVIRAHHTGELVFDGELRAVLPVSAAGNTTLHIGRQDVHGAGGEIHATRTADMASSRVPFRCVIGLDQEQRLPEYNTYQFSSPVRFTSDVRAYG